MMMNLRMAPLNTCTVQQPRAALNRLHILFHSAAVAAVLYYRFSNLLYGAVPLLSWTLITISEVIFTFIWILGLPFRLRLVVPENLPGDKMLPHVDVFVCTADPKKEPVVEVMNTVISAMALEYPPEKLAVYLSDDGGAAVTLCAMKEACLFAKSWVPFCRKYDIKTRCPQAFFSSETRDFNHDFKAHEDKLRSKFKAFKENVEKAVKTKLFVSANTDRPPHVEVIYDNKNEGRIELPLVVYVSREKRPSYPHRFKAGALNALVRLNFNDDDKNFYEPS